MNKFLTTLLLSFMIFSVDAAPITIGSVSDDYAWQDRFNNTMAEAMKDDVNAQFKVGEMFEKGRGTPMNLKQALTWYSKAAKQYHMKSRYRLGYLHFHGIGVPVNKTKAYTYLKIPAQNGDVRAQYYLGRLYATGQGVEKDAAKALSWYRRSSSGGYYLADKILAERNSPTSKILRGKWMQSHTTPAEYLPSITTECLKQVDAVVECLSGELNNNLNSLDITYVTKSLLFDIKKSGEFKVSFRNKIINFKKPTLKNSRRYRTETVASIKLGWQNVEHKLACKLIDNDTINCVKNGNEKIRFSRYFQAKTRPAQSDSKIMKQLVFQLD